MRDKIAIIATGGGMTCSYSVGVMKALVERFGLKSPEIVIACSGSAGTLSYFISKQYGEMVSIWADLLSTKKFINLWRFWKIIDIDYVIDEVFKKQEPLNVKNIYSSKIHYLIPAINYDSGAMEYFSNKNGDDIFEAMRATKAMPLAFNKVIKINGRRYCDSYLSSSAGIHIIKAIGLGANKLIILENGSTSKINKFLFDIWVSFRNKEFKRNNSKYLNTIRNLNLDKVRYCIIRPGKNLKITTLNNNQNLIRETIQQGYSETMGNILLEEFLK